MNETIEELVSQGLGRWATYPASAAMIRAWHQIPTTKHGESTVVIEVGHGGDQGKRTVRVKRDDLANFVDSLARELLVDHPVNSFTLTVTR